MATVAAQAFLDQVTKQLRKELERRFSRYEECGRSLEEIGPAEELARRMLAAVPEPSRWDDLREVRPAGARGDVLSGFG